jgi:pyridoxamine 5'-phosphate oxidase family protein
VTGQAFTAAEYQYLALVGRGRLSTIGRDGMAQVHPVAFVVDADRYSIDVVGRSVRDSQAYRNIRRDPRVSLSVGEPAPSAGDAAADCGLEISGTAVAAERSWHGSTNLGSDIIRILPIRLIARNIDLPGPSSRFVT